jgi:hypothetical protein
MYTTTIRLYSNSPYPSVVTGKRPAAAVPLLLWCPSSNGCTSPIATVGHVVHTLLLLAPTSVIDTLTSWTVPTMGHVAHTRLLLAPTAVMGTLTSVDRCYCWTRAHAWLLLAPIAMTGILTSVYHCYYWTRGTRTIAASAHSSDGHSDMSGLLLLLDTWHTHSCC